MRRKGRQGNGGSAGILRSEGEYEKKEVNASVDASGKNGMVKWT